MFLLKKRYWLSITILLTLFLVIRQFPATWVIYAVQKAAPGLQVSGVNGSLWKGEADYSQWVANGHSLPLGKLSWQLQGLSLLSLGPCIKFSAMHSAQAIKGDACYSVLSGKAVLSEVDATVSVASVAPFFNVDLDGTIDAYIQQATWHENQLGKTELNLLWQRASFYNGSLWVPLGNIQARANDRAGDLVSQWNHIEDAQQSSPPLKFDLNVSVTRLASVKPLVKVVGNATPSYQNQALNQMLQFVGEPAGDGSYRIDIQE